MTDEVEVLLRLYEAELARIRQYEDQRVALTNILLILDTAIIGVVTERGLSRDMAALCGLLIALGAFGALATQKLHERSDFYYERVRGWRKRIDEMLPNAKIIEAKELADKKQDMKHRYMQRIIQLHTLWLLLHVVIVIVGVVLTVLVLRPPPQ